MPRLELVARWLVGAWWLACSGLTCGSCSVAGASRAIAAETDTRGVAAGGVRALWIVRHDAADAEGVRNALDRAQRLGCTDVLLQVRGRADSYYASELVPRGEDLIGSFDALAEALSLAPARGLRVHAWINVLLAWSSPDPPRSSAHVVHRHPDWFVTLETAGGRRPSLEVDRAGLDALGIEGHYLSPGNAEVVEHLEGVVRELAGGYAIDGLHLDYVRFPDRQAAGRGDEVTALVTRLATAARTAAAQGGATWGEAARRDGTRGGAPRAEHREFVISAAVYPDPAVALERKGQDWSRWIERGIIDVAVPMCYGASRELMSAEMLKARQVDGTLWAGVAFYNKPLDVALQGIDAARDIGFSGVALFSHDALRALGPADELRVIDVLLGRRR